MPPWREQKKPKEKIITIYFLWFDPNLNLNTTYIYRREKSINMTRSSDRLRTLILDGVRFNIAFILFE